MPDMKCKGNSEVCLPENLFQNSSILCYQCASTDAYPVIDITANASSILGFTEQEFKGNKISWFERIHQEDRKEVKASYEELTYQEPVTIEYRFKHNEGYYLWLRDELKLIRRNQEKSDVIVGLVSNISDQKQVQAQYLEQQEKLKLQEQVISNINDMIVVTKAPKDDPLDAKIIFVNQAFKTFTGYSEKEVIGQSPTILHGKGTSQQVLDRIAVKIEDHQTLREEFINYTKDGMPYWAELDMAPLPSVKGDYEYWVGINRNVTKRKEADQKLEESEKRYRAMAELSFDAIFEIKLDGTIANCNQRACDLFGYNRGELIGMSTRKLVPQEYKDLVPDLLTDINTTGNDAWERTYCKKDGTRFPTEIHTDIYKLGDNKRLIAYVRDNTDRKEYENKIRKSLKEKETLLAEVHHRVKNNLAVISGMLEMQVMNTDDQQLLEKLQESQSRIQSIAVVHEKLYSSESFSEIKINQYVNDLLGMIVSSLIDYEKDIRVHKNVDTVTLTVSQAIPCGLLLNELITNCYKHAFEGRKTGVIKISVTQTADDYIVLQVKDDGIGLPEDFEIKKQSSLGMTLINTLVKQLEGTLKVTVEKGSCFTIKFPIDD